jgi:hypothetical protein
MLLTQINLFIYILLQNWGFYWLFFCYILFVCIVNYYLVIPIELCPSKLLRNTSITYHVAGLHKFFQKPGEHLKMLGARRVIWSRFHCEDPPILGTTVQNIVAWRLCCIGFVHVSSAVLHIVLFTGWHQYNETNMRHFLFSLLRIMGLYMFWALLAHPQEALHKRHLVYCVHVMSVSCTRIWVVPVTCTQYTKCSRRGCVVSITPRLLYPLERPGTHCTGGWVGPRAGLDMCKKCRPHRDSIPDCPACSQ